MSTSRDTFESVIYVNNEQAQDATEKLRQKLEKLNKEYEALNNAEEKDIKQILKKKKQIDSVTRSLESVTEGTENYKKAMQNLDQRSIDNLVKLKRQLNSEIRKLVPGTKEWIDLTENYKVVTTRLESVEKSYRDISVQQKGLVAWGSRVHGVFVSLTSIWNIAISAIRKFADAYRTISNFEQANANLASILGVTKNQMEELEKNAMQLGSTTRYTASEVTGLQTELAKLGFTQQEILSMSASVLRFAGSVGTDLSSAAAMAGVALRTFGLNTRDTEEVLGTMTVACNKSALSFTYLENAFSTVAPVANAYGLSIKDTVALLGALANAGFDASSAATATRNILLNLADANGKLAKELGGSVNTFGDIMQAFIKLRDGGVKLNETLELTDKRSVAAFNAFLKGAESSLELRDVLEDVGGEMKRIAEERADTVEGAIAGMQSAWEGLVLTFRKSSGPIKGVINTITTAIRGMQDVIDPKGSRERTVEGWFSNAKEGSLDALDAVERLRSEYEKVMGTYSKVEGKTGEEMRQVIEDVFEREMAKLEVESKAIEERIQAVNAEFFQKKLEIQKRGLGITDGKEFNKIVTVPLAELDKEWNEAIALARRGGEAIEEVEAQTSETRKQLRDKELAALKKEYGEKIGIVDARLNYEQKALKVQLMKQEITQEEYDNKIIEKKSEALAEKLALAKKYHQDETKLSAEGMDLEIEKLQRDSNAKKKNYDKELAALKQSQKDEETELKKQLTKNEITQDEYDSKMLAVKVNYLKQSVDLAAKYGQDETQIMQAYLDAQVEAEILALQQMEKLKKEAKDVKDSLRTPDEVRTDGMATELERLEELHDAKLLSEEEYEKAVQAVHDKYKQQQLDDDLGHLKGYFEKANKVIEGVSEFTSALQSAETAKLEAEYQARLTAAGDNAEQREAIEAEYEQKKLDIQKKYADVDMAINIAKAIAAGALASVEAIAAAGGNPVLSAVFIALIAATTAAEVANIIAQRNAIKNASAGGGGGSAPKTGSREMTGYAEGGYTEDHTTVTTVGERGREWVAPAWMVRKNPVTFSNLERYRKTGSHGRSGSVSRGFADGGFTENVSEKMQGGMLSVGDLEAAVETAIVKSMQNGAIRAYLVRNDLTELDAQTERLKKMTSR